MGRRARPDVTRCTRVKSRLRDGSAPIAHRALDLYDESSQLVDNFPHASPGLGMLVLAGAATAHRRPTIDAGHRPTSTGERGCSTKAYGGLSWIQWFRSFQLFQMFQLFRLLR